jgi:hypothetical protein
MPNEIRHQKNAAEWIMWFVLLPAYWMAIFLGKPNDQ